ncbi:ferritin-like domain-containing protein [Kitasatospora sp. NPDC049285]|uniref:ferritin-like domain-containing protein n=1 Tax=Kitasatospora sp. NPDC049285 TaxID=3157096 RepID=UPI003439B1A3
MPSPTRRTFLALGAFTGLQLVCGCTDDHQGTAQQRAEDADRPLRLRQLAATDALLAGYDSLLATSPANADRLTDLREDVAQHRTALAQSLPASSGSPSASVSGSGSASASAGAIRSVAELAAAERQTVGIRLGDLAAASPALAKVLAAVAASGAAHAATLGDTTPITLPTGASASPSASVSASAATSASAAAGTESAKPSAMPTGDADALQAVLAAEHAAVYGYGVVGAFLPTGPQREDGRTAYTAHQARRDAWQRLLATSGVSPTAAAPGYRLPFAVKDAATAGQLAAYLEVQLTAAYADLAAAGPTLRMDGATALRECALRATHWGADLPALPGLTPTEPTPTASGAAPSL